MKSILLIGTMCSLLLVTAACRHEADRAAPPASADTAVRAEASPAATPPVATGLDAAKLVGRFGVRDSVLDLKAADSDEPKVFDLKADGRYTFTGGVVRSREDGRWALEEGGKRLRMTPDHIIAESGQLLFDVSPPDQLILLSPDGSPMSGTPGLVRIRP